MLKSLLYWGPMAKLLVVDDELGLREALYYAFTMRGHQVITAINNEHAMELLSERTFDLIILDIVMPGELGSELLKRLRASGSKVPIVIYSVRVDAELEKEMHQAGANEVMNKSVSLPVLIDRTEKVLRASGRVTLPSEHLRKLLVIDEEKSVRGVLATFFGKIGYQVVEAPTAEEGLEKVRSEDPDIVLLDIQTGGIETLKKIHEEFPKLGVVMSTYSDKDERCREAMEQGAYGYVLKPFDFLYLELVVASRLSIAQTPDEPRT